MFLCLEATITIFISSFFLNDTATTEIYTLSLHDALPIWKEAREQNCCDRRKSKEQLQLRPPRWNQRQEHDRVRRSCSCSFDRSEEHTLNSSHLVISYAVFCLKKKKKTTQILRHATIHLES